VANGRKFFPEREYVHSGQAWLWSFPTISKECRAGPGESVMAEHRATKQKVYTFQGSISVSVIGNGAAGKCWDNQGIPSHKNRGLQTGDDPQGFEA
jgi:hypothetical protein